MKLPSKNVNNHENLRFRNSVRPDPAARGPRKLRVVFLVILVLTPPQLPYGAKYLFWGVLQVRRCSSEPEGVPPPNAQPSS